VKVRLVEVALVAVTDCSVVEPITKTLPAPSIVVVAVVPKKAVLLTDSIVVEALPKVPSPAIESVPSEVMFVLIVVAALISPVINNTETTTERVTATGPLLTIFSIKSFNFFIFYLTFNFF